MTHPSKIETIAFINQKISSSELVEEIKKEYFDRSYLPFVLVKSCTIECDVTLNIDRITLPKPRWIPSRIWNILSPRFDTINGVPVRGGLWKDNVFKGTNDDVQEIVHSTKQ